MATSTTKLGLTKPDFVDVVDITDLNNNADKLDSAIGSTIVTSTTRPSTPFTGQVIFETDTELSFVWDGSAWKPVNPSIPLDSLTDVTLTSPTANQVLKYSGTQWVNGAVVGVEAGAVMSFAMNTAPTGWLKANGANVSRTTYANLFAAIGTTYGAGDGSTTFAVPDMRGEFPRGWDDGRGVDSGRVFGSAQGDAMRNFTGSFRVTAIEGALTTGVFFTSANATSGYAGGGGTANTRPTYSIDPSTQVPTAAENRSRNRALLYCIKF